MQKFFSYLLPLFVVVSLLASCTAEKCYECTGTGAGTYCEGDYANATEFEAYVDVIQAAGATCTVK
jgi:hypothetical protein